MFRGGGGGRVSTTGWMTSGVRVQKPHQIVNSIDILVQQVCIIGHIRYYCRRVEVTLITASAFLRFLQTSRPI